MRFLASASSSSFDVLRECPGRKRECRRRAVRPRGCAPWPAWPRSSGWAWFREVTQPASNIGIASAAAASSLSFMTSPRAQSARRLLVVVVFLPEPLFELRIGFLFGGLAQALARRCRRRCRLRTLLRRRRRRRRSSSCRHLRPPIRDRLRCCRPSTGCPSTTCRSPERGWPLPPDRRRRLRR